MLSVAEDDASLILSVKACTFLAYRGISFADHCLMDAMGGERHLWLEMIICK